MPDGVTKYSFRKRDWESNAVISPGVQVTFRRAVRGIRPKENRRHLLFAKNVKKTVGHKSNEHLPSDGRKV